MVFWNWWQCADNASTLPLLLHFHHHWLLHLIFVRHSSQPKLTCYLFYSSDESDVPNQKIETLRSLEWKDTLASGALNASCLFTPAADSFWLQPPYKSIPLQPASKTASTSSFSIFFDPFVHVFSYFSPLLYFFPIYNICFSKIFFYYLHFSIFNMAHFSGSATASSSFQPITLWTTESENVFIDLCVEFMSDKRNSVSGFCSFVAAAFNDKLNLDGATSKWRTNERTSSAFRSIETDFCR